ncbi:MAG: hypothetical protein RBR08_12050 [Desulforegulaceae bacterium]|nr:hypothetical protein [Desulforegulaceae bacterium]
MDKILDSLKSCCGEVICKHHDLEEIYVVPDSYAGYLAFFTLLDFLEAEKRNEKKQNK